MSSIESIQRKITQLKNDEIKLRQRQAGYEADAAKKRTDAKKKRDSARRTSSSTSQASRLRDAAKYDDQAIAFDKKVANVTKDLARNLDKQRAEAANLERAQKAAARQRDRDDKRQRKETEARYTRQIAELSRPTTIHRIEMITPPKPEVLRVLYLTATPQGDLRLDYEVKQVKEAIQKATHRDLVDVEYMPAATPDDLLDGLNRTRPHIVHFSGHADVSGISFDIDEPDPAPDAETYIKTAFIARALKATDHRPRLLVLNACESAQQAAELLDAVPMVVGMQQDAADVAAIVFAARFYAAVAEGQSVRAAVDQASVAIDMAGLAEGWNPVLECADEIDPAEVKLVLPPS
jgi:hypothetical protein